PAPNAEIPQTQTGAGAGPATGREGQAAHQAGAIGQRPLLSDEADARGVGPQASSGRSRACGSSRAARHAPTGPPPRRRDAGEGRKEVECQSRRQKPRGSLGRGPSPEPLTPSPRSNGSRTTT